MIMKPGLRRNGKLLAVVSDIDGVLACNQHRLHHLFPEEGCDPDWKAYNDAVLHDPILPTTHILKELNEVGFLIILLSSRNNLIRSQTLEWLKNNEVPFDDIILRGQYTDIPYEHSEFKPGAMAKLMEIYEITMMFEDDPLSVEKVSELGVPVIHVYSGYYDGGRAEMPNGQ